MVQHVQVPLSVSTKESDFFPEQKQRQAQKLIVAGADSKTHQPGNPAFCSSLGKVTAAQPPLSSGTKTQSPDSWTPQSQKAESKWPSLILLSILYLGSGLIFKPTKRQKVTHQAYLSCHSSPESPSPCPCHSQTNRLPPPPQILINVCT